MARIIDKLLGTNSLYKRIENFIQNNLSLNLYYSDTEAKVEDRILKQLEKVFGKENVDSQHYVGGIMD